MTDPLSLTEAKRLAGTRRHDPAARDAHRGPRDADRRVPAPRRRRHARLPARVRRGRRAARAATASWASGRGGCSRSATASPARRPGPVGVDRLRARPARSPRPRRRTRSPRCGPSSRSGASLPTEGMPRFTGGAVGALAYDAIGAFEPSVPLPGQGPGRRPAGELHRDRPRHRVRPPEPPAVGDRLAAHRGARPRRPLPDRRAGDLRGPRADGPPAARPRWRRPSGGPRRPTAPATEAAFREVDTSASAATSTSGRSSTRRTRSRPARRSRSSSPAASRSTSPPPPDGTPIDGIGLYRALRRVNPSPYLFFTRTPSFEVVGASPELLLQVVGDRMTTHPIAGTRPRGATPADDDRLADELRGDPKERAEHVMLVDLGRNDLGRVARAGHGDHQPVHGGRALQPRPPPREPRRGEAAPGAGRARRAARGVPRGHADRRAQDPRDAADRRGRGRAARAVWWRGGLSRLRRQPRHGDHDPERGPQGRPGARPHGRRDRGQERARSPSSRRPSTRRRR